MMKPTRDWPPPPLDEAVDHPDYYNQGEIEVIDFIVDQGWGDGFCAGNAVKYIARYKKKGKAEDLQKALWYLTVLEQIVSGTYVPKYRREG